MHERAARTDLPRYVGTEAWQWESGRIIEPWTLRGAAELFHACGKQGTGVEAAQVRPEEAVNRPLPLRCVAQSLLQRAPAVASAGEKVEVAQGQIPCGQRCRASAREACPSLLQVARRLFADGRSWEQVLQVLMPA